MKFWYPASITQITSINDSFDSCILSVCYAGRNRNKTIISKEAIENAIATMSYCPIVANYDVDTDTIGGHDVGFAEGSDGSIKMVNLTDAVGVIPESPQWCWQKKVDDDGVEREYLTTPAILWKRTPVYSKLKREGVSGQSMEINVKDGKVVDGLFEIDAFEFTAFCLLGDDIEPCFEGAQVEMFSLENLSRRVSEMMDAFKQNFTTVMAASADDNNQTPKNGENSWKGGESSLNINELLQEYGLVAEDVGFSMDGLSEQEIRERFAALKSAKFDDDPGDNDPSEEEPGEQEPGGDTNGEQEGDSTETQGSGQTEEQGSEQTGVQGDNEATGQDGEQGTGSGGSGDGNTEESPTVVTDDGDDDVAGAGKGRRQYALTGEQMRCGVLDALRSVMYHDEWGDWPRYCYCDYDMEVNEVYAYDNEDWNLYGFKYTMNGDIVVIDFNSKTRKKLAFVDFDNGDATFNYKHILDSANARFAAIANEVSGLREFKRNVEMTERKAKEAELFAKFADLNEDARFNALREDCSGLSLEEIEDKCYALRGRNVQVRFSQATPAPIRVPVERINNHSMTDEPYGGIFVEFGVGN